MTDIQGIRKAHPEHSSGELKIEHVISNTLSKFAKYVVCKMFAYTQNKNIKGS